MASDGWISAEKKLPADEECVLMLISYKVNGVVTHERIVAQIVMGELFTEVGDDIGWEIDVLDFWRPLPAPPEATR